MFDANLDRWLAWQDEPWARVRYAVVGHVLDTHLHGENPPLRVLDVGGGDGKDSLRLAAAGSEVTILDYSEAMLGQARENAAALGVLDRVHLVGGGMEGLADFADADFDVVLCHFVVQYLADPAEAVRGVVEAARVGGLLSLVAPNPASEVFAKAVRGKDPSAALTLLDSPTFRAAAFEHDVARVHWRAAARDLRAAGAEVVGRYGSRCFIDLVDDDVFTSDPEHWEDILRLEIAVCATSPYRDVARAWQLVARRR